MTSTEATGMNYTDPEAVAAAVAAVAGEAGSRGFLAAISERADLIEAAARLATADGLWVNILDGRLQDAGLSIRTRDKWAATIKRTQAAQAREDRRTARGFREVAPDEPPPSVRAILPGAPVGPDIVPPAGYQLTLDRGVIDQTGENPATVAYRPVIISGAIVNRATGAHRVRLNWWDRNRWHGLTVDRGTVMSASELTKQAAYGVPVNSGTARALVGYLAAYEAVNGDILPRQAVSNHLGWQDDGTFLVGGRSYRPGEAGGPAIDIEDTPPEQWRTDGTAFMPPGDGERQYAAAFSEAGTLAGWQDAVRPVAAFPAVAFGIYASLAAPLLRILDCPSFWVDWCGPSSQGKTSTLTVAASVWGSPSLISNWNATKNFIQERAAVSVGLPVCLDETKLANARDVSAIVYMLAGETGRGRAQRDGGSRSVATWRTVGLSTGEKPLADFSQADGGTHARILTLWGQPWGATSPDTAQAVAQVREGIAAHHGHAGAAFMGWVMERHDRWPDWRAAYAEEVARYSESTGGEQVASRIGQYAAAISLAAVIAHEAGILPWAFADPITPLWGAFLTESNRADRATEALRLTHSWAVSMRHHFDGQLSTGANGQNEIPPTNGYIGRWRETDPAISFLPHRLDKFLTESGFDAGAVVRTWADRGWLLVDTTSGRGVRTQSQFRMPGDHGATHNTRGYRVRLDAIAEAIGTDDGSPTGED